MASDIILIDEGPGGDSGTGELVETLRSSGSKVMLCESLAEGLERLEDLFVSDSPAAAALIGTRLPSPVRAARQINRIDPHLQLVFLADETRQAQLRRELRFAPLPGTHWSLASLGDRGSALNVVRNAALSSAQRRSLRTTLDRLNLQLASTPPPDSADYRKLVASDRYLASIMSFARDAIISTDGEGKIVSWNSAAERLFGYPEHRAQGEPADILVFEAERKSLRELFEGLRGDSSGATAEFSARRADGTAFNAELSVAPVRGEAGRQTGAVIIVHDITERKQAEEQLQTLANAIPQLAWMAHADGHIFWYNRRWYEYTGTTPEQMEGWGWQSVHDPEMLPRVVKRWKVSLETGEPFEMEFPLKGADGLFRWFLTRVTPHTDGRGGVLRWFGTNTDVEELRSALRQAEESNRLKDEFLATVSHELRTPLTAVLGWAHLLRSGQLDGEASARALETIERNARAQNRMIEELLDVSRIITGKLRLDVRQVDLPLVVEAAVESVRPAADAKAVRLQLVLDPRAGPISGDPDRLQQVIWNLLSNAVKFTHKGGRVQVRLERINSHVELTVSDTGPGIEPDFLPFVFDRFRQADMTKKRAHGGLGLGLAIARHLVELHGGAIRAASGGTEQGATFTVTLPLMVVRAEPSPAERRHPAAVEGVPYVSGPALDGLRVLVVDDEPDTRELLAAVLKGRGAVVTLAASAGEALKALERETPHVLVSDIGMPGEDGYELIRRVRLLPPERGGNIPAAALTAYAREDDRIRALLTGFQIHIPKPVNPAELAAVVATLAGRVVRDSQ
ncbi:MAG TPA: PAS domain S-box protein [Pyrinomonadaceae bacterium]|nr:PAS domain S-box protein [Pyrinomonadaceae bacterium]